MAALGEDPLLDHLMGACDSVIEQLQATPEDKGKTVWWAIQVGLLGRTLGTTADIAEPVMQITSEATGVIADWIEAGRPLELVRLLGAMFIRDVTCAVIAAPQATWRERVPVEAELRALESAPNRPTAVIDELDTALRALEVPEPARARVGEELKARATRETWPLPAGKVLEVRLSYEQVRVSRIADIGLLKGDVTRQPQLKLLRGPKTVLLMNQP